MPESLIGQDGLHPTEEGYQRLAEIYLDAIKSTYESSPPAAVASPAAPLDAQLKLRATYAR
jgi:hypothetical protein